MEGIIRMFNGRMVDVFNLRPEDVIPINFIHAMSCINRYTGASPFPISVMRHTLALTDYIDRNVNDLPAFDAREHAQVEIHWSSWKQNMAKASFLHDWSEALFNDLATPVKRNMPDYEKHEQAAQEVIFDVFGVPIKYLEEIHQYDKAIYLDEVRSSWGFVPDDRWKSGRVPLGITFTERHWREDRTEGLKMFNTFFPEVWSGAVVL